MRAKMKYSQEYLTENINLNNINLMFHQNNNFKTLNKAQIHIFNVICILYILYPCIYVLLLTFVNLFICYVF